MLVVAVQYTFIHTPAPGPLSTPARSPLEEGQAPVSSRNEALCHRATRPLQADLPEINSLKANLLMAK